MPIRSRAQQGFLFAKYPKMAKRWAKETPNMKNLPKKVKKLQKENIVNRPPLNNLQFWVVAKPTGYQQNIKNIMNSCDPFQFAQMTQQGLSPDQVHGFYLDQDEAMNRAKELLQDLYGKAKALEAKKQEVSERLQKTIDELQKQAESHMKQMKLEPEAAEAHQIKAEKILERMKQLRETHKTVEGSKQQLEEMNYEDLKSKKNEKTNK